jgi:hypothetical protein
LILINKVLEKSQEKELEQEKQSFKKSKASRKPEVFLKLCFSSGGAALPYIAAKQGQ